MSIIPPNLNHSFICPVPVPFPDSAFPIPDSGFRFPDSGFSIRIRIPDSGFRFLDSGFLIFPYAPTVQQHQLYFSV